MGRARAEAAVPPVVTPQIAAEAAVWVARLHGPARSRAMEQECLAWQARSPAHREAFECCTDTWLSVPRVSLADAFAARPEAAGPRRSGFLGWAAAALVLVVLAGAVGYQHWRERGVYATGVGEQQLVVLDDGTRMTLNTDTRLRVDLAARQRTVSIRSGEALFEVAKDPQRPFVVRAGGSEVVAIGTVFAVRFAAQDDGQNGALAVTLIEGQVALQAAPDADGLAPRRAVRMVAGERARLSGGGSGAGLSAGVEVDRPNIEHLVAWKRSEAVFDDVSLFDAVSEMNRYSRTPITLLGASRLADLRVSGSYRTGDTAGFANAVAALHGLQVQSRGGRLELSKPQ